MKSNLYLIIFFFCINTVISQAPIIEWEHSYGGFLDDNARSVQQTNDGGYIMAGTTNSTNGVSGNHGGHDYWVVKVDSSGVIEWQRAYGGSLYDRASAVKQTNDNGYIVIGASNSTNGDITVNNGDYDFWVLKIDSLGNIQWQKSYGGTNSDQGSDVIQTSDGGYTLVGPSYSYNGDVSGHHGLVFIDIWVVKIDSVGTIQWETSLGGSKSDNAFTIEQTPDGGYITAGYSGAADGDVTTHYGSEQDCWIVKISASGGIEWQKSYGGSDDESACSIVRTSDNGYILTGYANSTDGILTENKGQYDCWVIKVNPFGEIEWQKTYGGSANDFGLRIRETMEHDGYILAGYTESSDGDVTQNHGNTDFWIIKLNTSGTIEWQKTLGGTEEDNAYDFIQNNNKEYIVIGETKSNNGDISLAYGFLDFWLVKLSSEIYFFEQNQFVCEGDSVLIYGTYQSTAGQYMSCEAGTCDTIYVTELLMNSTNTNLYVVDQIITSNAVNANYQWLDCANSFNPIPGETNQSYSVVSNGEYAVLVTENGCSDTSGCILISNVSLTSNDVCEAITLYPNPTDGFFYIDFGRVNDDVVITITDIQGKEIRRDIISNKEFISLNLDGSAGIYFVSYAIKGQKNIIIKLVKN